jgi:hypothetical protein
VSTVWRLLQDEHDRIWALLAEISGGAGRPRPEPARQRRLALGLVGFQSAHELAEEAVVWPVVRRRCAEGDELVTEALAQECVLKRALNELRRLSPGSQEFTECANSVAAENRTHLSYEQNQIWPRLADALDAAEAQRLAARWQAARRRAPTRPHPHLPARPWVLATAGSAAAAADRVRDAVTRRGSPSR